MKRLGARTLQGKIFLYVIPFLVIPSLLSFYVLDQPLERNIEEKIGKSVQESLNLVRFNMEQSLGDMMTAMTLVMLDNELLHALRGGGGDYATYKATLGVFKQAIGVALGNHDYRMMLVAGQPARYYYASLHTPGFDLQRITESQWYAELTTGPPAFRWIYHHADGQPPMILLGRAIADLSGDDRLGVAVISIPYPSFAAVVKQMEGEIFLLDEHGKRLSQGENGSALGDAAENGDETLFARMRGEQRGQFNAEFGNDKYLINFDTIQANGWKIVQQIPRESVFKEISQVRQINLIVILVIFFVFTLIMYGLSRRIARPLRLLKLKMSQMSDAKLSSYLQVPSGNRDEVSDLVDAYNKMLRQIKELLANLQQEQRHKENMRFKALQAQMNPHFILNTINNIKWMAYMRQDHEVAEMITSLAVIVEASIGRGEDIIPLRAEIEYIESYINLHKIKLNEALTLVCDIPADLLACGVVKFSLQPLVENSILHGFGRWPRDGIIRIDAKKESGNLIIRVIDNGCGIDEEKLSELRERLQDNRQNVHYERIGLLNLQERLRLTFGVGAGLQIENRAEGGCQVAVTVPYFELDTARGWSDVKRIDRG